MNILLTAIGTSGDVDPFVGLGRALKRRGHRVTVIANGYYQGLIEGAELQFASWGDAEVFKAQLDNPEYWDPRRSLAFAVREMMLPGMRPLYHAIADRYEPGQTVVAANLMAVGARLAHEKLGVPLATVYLQPSVIRNVHLMSAQYRLLVPRWSPGFYKRMWTRLAGAIGDRLIGPPINAARAELDLPPIRHGLFRWFRSPQAQIGLFPSWFAPPQPDWPAELTLTGFPLYDERGVAPMPLEVEQFLDAGEPPIVFTFGTGMRQAHEIFVEAVAACRTLGRRGILLTRFKEQLPPDLPEGVRHFAYVPFSDLLPRVAALVHHGGIGTLAQALAAGIPQVVVPFAYDQPDNAALLDALGVSKTVTQASYSAAAVVHALKELLGSPEAAARCHAVAQRLRQERPLDEAAQVLEGLVPVQGPGGP